MVLQRALLRPDAPETAPRPSPRGGRAVGEQRRRQRPRGPAAALVFAAALGFTLGFFSYARTTAAAGDDGVGAPGLPRPAHLGAQLANDPQGVRVTAVLPDSPAAVAGLAPGDVILRIDGHAMSAPQAVVSRVRAHAPGSALTLDVLRMGVRRTLRAVLVQAPRVGAAVNEPAPALNARVVMGSGPAELARLRGRVVVLDFWATWCGPCRMVMPALDQLQRRYGAQGLTVLGVTDEDPGTARLAGARMNVSYTLATDPLAAQQFGVRALPTLMVLDRRGVVRRVSAGASAEELRAVEQLVARLLNERAP